MSLKEKLQTLSKEYQALESQYGAAVANRQRLDSQQIENEQVKKEFDALEDGKQIYKLVGPILMKQDANEAKANVKNRLERIADSINVVEEKIKELDGTVEAKRMEIVHVQTQLQQQAQTEQQQPRIPEAAQATSAS